jgi:GT2 family glycosyltransferase
MRAVSIVVPVHDRAALTRRCLDAVLAGLPPGCEVIVVDDASRDWTATLLAGYGESVRVIALGENGGYARACNRGAAAALHDTLVFLNNDTEPRSGWLRALCAYADANPAAAVVGAKLLYPTGAVQHAGVVIGQDGFPHNLYGGLPGEHPAVNRSRPLQAVTGACMLVGRAVFEQAGGFDPSYVNSLEDIDLCLRIGRTGAEVHYCHEAVVTHLESASRGREQRFQESVRRWRERWRERAARDDLSIYHQDGLLALEYGDAYPLRMSISPLLASVDAGRESEIETLLESYAGQVSDLLAEVVRLTAITASDSRAQQAAALARPAAGLTRAEPGPTGGAGGRGELDHRDFLARANRLEEQVRELQQQLADGAIGSPGAQQQAASPAAFTASRRLGYRRLVERVRGAVAERVPAGAEVLVVSRGDRALLELEDRVARHFPQDAGGDYLGHHPRDGAEAIAWLEQLRAAGAEYLVLPATAYWWLEHYTSFAGHLRERYPVADCDVCSIYRLDAEPAGRSEQDALSEGPLHAGVVEARA